MNTKEDAGNKYVYLHMIIGDYAKKYNIEIITIENLIKLGKRVDTLYRLKSKYRRITFSLLCEYIIDFINTPFGLKTLKDMCQEL